MSLLHDALKKAESLDPSLRGKGSEGVHVDSEPGTGRSNLRVLLLSVLASVLLLFVAYQKFVKKPAAPVASPINFAAQAATAAMDGPKLLEEASKLMQTNRYEEARKLLEKASVANLPDDKAAEAYNNLGFVKKKLGQNEDAFQAYQKALSLNPNCVECRNNLGVLYLENHEFTEAETNFQQAIQSKPDYAEPYFHMALLMESRGDSAGAKKYYTRYLDAAHGLNADFLLKIQERMAALEAK